ncbi:GDP-mannose 6-dehydrogenase [compost metagenome]
MSSLLNANFEQVVNDAEIIILGNRDEQFRALADRAPEGKQVIDLVGFMNKSTCSTSRTEGICW